MPHLERLRFRPVGAADAIAVAALHADSWRRHYRGAYSDSFLDGDVAADRERVWTERLRTADGATQTVLAEDAAGIVGFAHVVFDSSPIWGALLDNLHVAQRCRRQGVGSELLVLMAQPVTERDTSLSVGPRAESARRRPSMRRAAPPGSNEPARQHLAA